LTQKYFGSLPSEAFNRFDYRDIFTTTASEALDRFSDGGNGSSVTSEALDRLDRPRLAARASSGRRACTGRLPCSRLASLTVRTFAGAPCGRAARRSSSDVRLTSFGSPSPGPGRPAHGSRRSPFAFEASVALLPAASPVSPFESTRTAPRPRSSPADSFGGRFAPASLVPRAMSADRRSPGRSRLCRHVRGGRRSRPPGRPATRPAY